YVTDQFEHRPLTLGRPAANVGGCRGDHPPDRAGRLLLDRRRIVLPDQREHEPLVFGRRRHRVHRCHRHMLGALLSRRSRSRNASTASASWPPSRVRTLTWPLSSSRSPTTAM